MLGFFRSFANFTGSMVINQIAMVIQSLMQQKTEKRDYDFILLFLVDLNKLIRSYQQNVLM